MVPINFFKTVDTYGAMLNKLATANFFVALLAFYFLTTQCPELKNLVDKFSLKISISGSKIPAGYLLPPLALAIFFRIIKLHDRISDIFRIRAYYDWEYILNPMIKAVGSEVEKKKVMSSRGSLMPKVFYHYTSSRDQNLVIDKHLIEMVLDQLTWYWMMIESSLIVFSVSAVLIYLKTFDYVLITFYLGLGLVIFSKTLQQASSTYTRQEVEVILNYAPRKQEIKEQFDALQN